MESGEEEGGAERRVQPSRKAKRPPARQSSAASRDSPAPTPAKESKEESSKPPKQARSKIWRPWEDNAKDDSKKWSTPGDRRTKKRRRDPEAAGPARGDSSSSSSEEEESGGSPQALTLPPRQAPIPGFDPADYYVTESNPSVHFRGRVVESSFRVRLTRTLPGEGAERLRRLHAILHHAFDAILRQASPESVAQLYAINSSLFTGCRASKRDHPTGLSFDDLAEAIEAAVQSSGLGDDSPESVRLEETEFCLVLFRPRVVGTLPTGLRSRNELSIRDFLTKKSTFIDPMHASYGLCKKWRKDGCLLAVFVLGFERARLGLEGRKQSSPELIAYLRFECPERMTQVAVGAGLIPPCGPWPLSSLASMVAYVNGQVEVQVFTKAAPPFLRFGPRNAAAKIYIYVLPARQDTTGISSEPSPGHVVLMRSPAGLMGTQSYCDQCGKGHNEQNHRCPEAACQLCRVVGCAHAGPAPSMKSAKFCEKCGLTFLTGACFDAHSASCIRHSRCGDCYELVPKSRKHRRGIECGRPHCSSCKRRHSPLELCWVESAVIMDKAGEAAALMPAGGEENALEEAEESSASEDQAEEALPAKPSQPKNRLTRFQKDRQRPILYCDAECRIDPETGIHKANLIVAQLVKPGVAGFEQEIFKGDASLTNFVQALIAKKSKYAGSTVIFHNFSGYDGHLIHAELLRLSIQPRVLYRGQRILSLDLKQGGGLRFRDSLLYIPGTSLAQFGSIFSLPVCKGYFPFPLNNGDYCDFDKLAIYRDEATGSRFPVLELFRPHERRPKERVKLEQWHAAKLAKYQEDPQKTYCPAEKLIKYCIKDTEVLRLGFEKYREEWDTKYPKLCLLSFITFVSYNNAVFRTYFMIPKSIMMVSDQGFFTGNRISSRMAHGWLCIRRKELEETGVKIDWVRHARAHYEPRICGVHVDGLGYDEQNKTVTAFLFQGCYWHGCTKCQTGSKRTERQDAHWENTARVMERLHRVAARPWNAYGDTLVIQEVWECEFKASLKPGTWQTEYYRQHVRKWEPNNLKPREGFFGGRTNAALHLLPKIDASKHVLRYYDVTSLYPYCQMSGVWPLGRPDVFIGFEVEDRKLPPLAGCYGLWKTRVLVPQHLKLPVLPFRHKSGRLIFGNCQTCVLEMKAGFCTTHSEAERLFEGVYFTGELALAERFGATVMRPSEAWDWPQQRRTKDLFASFIKEMYGAKAKASGFPDDPAEQEQVLLELKESVGLELSKEDFAECKMKRALSKLAINSVWGYLARQGAPVSTLVTSEEDDLDRIANSPDLEVKSMRVLHGGGFVRVDYKKRIAPATKNGSIVLGLITTALARMQLYELLAAAGDEAVYWDTDSVLRLEKAGPKAFQTSARLGGLKEEIEATYGKNCRIISFICLGPKSYALTIVDEKGNIRAIEIRCKGMTLSSEASEIITPELMERLVANPKDETIVPQFNIARKLDAGIVFSRYFGKKIRFSSTKRWLAPGRNAELRTLPFGYRPLDGPEDDGPEDQPRPALHPTAHRDHQLEELLALLEAEIF